MTGALAFFGAFNPPTLAHLTLAEYALMETGRQKVVFVPSKSAYIRGEQGKSFAFSDEERLSLLRLALSSRPWMEVWDGEIYAPAQPRTYHTLCRLRDAGIQASLLMGSDKLRELSTVWRHVEDICREFGIVCMERQGDDCKTIIGTDPYLSALSPCIRVIHTPKDTQYISSTQVRERLLTGGEIGGLVPPDIEKALYHLMEEKRNEA